MDIVRGVAGSALAMAIFMAMPVSAQPRLALTVSPSENLSDGQSVTVSVRGFPGPGSKWTISECATASGASRAGSTGCGDQPAAQAFLVTDAHGSGAAPFTVRARATDAVQSVTVNAAGAPRSPCTGHCVIAVFDGSRVLTAPISFAPGLPRTGAPIVSLLQLAAWMLALGAVALVGSRVAKPARSVHR